MNRRVFIKPDGTLLVTTFARKARFSNESADAFMDRATQKLDHKDLPYFDIPEDPDPRPAKTLPDGTCGRCRWRAKDGAVIIDNSAPCVCGKDEYRLIGAKIESPIAAIAIQGLLELERFKIKNIERK